MQFSAPHLLVLYRNAPAGAQFVVGAAKRPLNDANGPGPRTVWHGLLPGLLTGQLGIQASGIAAAHHAGNVNAEFVE
jgi:hypothetical protein